MIKEAIDRILELGGPRTIPLNGKYFSDKNLIPVQLPMPSAVRLCTLQGILDEWRRPDYALSQVSRKELSFGTALSHEGFNIFVQANFVANEDRARMLKIIGNIQDENIKTLADDGVTQRVTVKTGLAKVGEVNVENPFMLAPFRTFPEVAQPVSPFILRLSGNSASLHEADNGAWEIEAIKNIAEWFKVNDATHIVA